MQCGSALDLQQRFDRDGRRLVHVQLPVSVGVLAGLGGVVQTHVLFCSRPASIALRTACTKAASIFNGRACE
jgi:hypothetical protein